MDTGCGDKTKTKKLVSKKRNGKKTKQNKQLENEIDN